MSETGANKRSALSPICPNTLCTGSLQNDESGYGMPKGCTVYYDNDTKSYSNTPFSPHTPCSPTKMLHAKDKISPSSTRSSKKENVSHGYNLETIQSADKGKGKQVCNAGKKPTYITSSVFPVTVQKSTLLNPSLQIQKHKNEGSKGVRNGNVNMPFPSTTPFCDDMAFSPHTPCSPTRMLPVKSNMSASSTMSFGKENVSKYCNFVEKGKGKEGRNTDRLCVRTV